MARYYNFCTTRTTHFHFICIQSAFASYLPHSISHDSHSIHCPQYVPTRSTTLCFSNCQLFCHFTSLHLLQILFLLSTLWVWCLEVSCVAGTYARVWMEHVDILVYTCKHVCVFYTWHTSIKFQALKLLICIELEFRVSDLYGGRRACVIATFMGKYVRT